MIVEKQKFEASSNNKKYKIEGIYNSAFYTRKLKMSYLLCFYYFVLWKSDFQDRST